MQITIKIHPTSKRAHDVATGDEIAVRVRGMWIDPYGGTFSDAEREAFDALLASWDAINLC